MDHGFFTHRKLLITSFFFKLVAYRADNVQLRKRRVNHNNIRRLLNIQACFFMTLFSSVRSIEGLFLLVKGYYGNI